jgi:P pilus assembly chaperone PapD
VVWALLLALAPPAGGQPRIAITEGASFDLGRIYRGTVVEKKLTVTNPGTADLVLGQVEASCGCTGTVVAETNVPPGGSTTILVHFNSRTFEGPVHKSITVNSNAVDHPQLKVEFTAVVVVEFAVDPAQFWFRNAEVGRRQEAVVAVTNNGTTPVEFSSYTTRLKGLSVTLPAAPIAPGQTDSVRAVFTAEAAANIIIEDVRITTSSPRQQELVIPVFGNAREFTFEQAIEP